MYYFVALLFLICLSRTISGSWRKTFVLPWVVLTTPLLLGAGLANLDLVPLLISPWSAQTHTAVVLGTIALVVGSFTLKNIHSPLKISSMTITWNESTLVKVLVAVTCVTVTANMLEFFLAGIIPLFSPDPDHARIEASKNGYIHVLGVLAGHLIPIAAFILLTGKDLKKGTKRILLAIITVCFVVLFMWIARGMLIYPILTVVALDYLLSKRSFGFKKIIAITIVCIVIVAGVKYLRDYIRFGETFVKTQNELATSDAGGGMIGPAVSLYLTTALNYEILNRYVEAVPSLLPNTNGRLVINHLLSFVPGTGRPFTELEYQNIILEKQEYDFTLTSSFLGIPYLEFGMAGVLFFSFIIGLLYKIVWVRMLQKGTPLSIFFYGYLIAMTAFMPFTFIYSQVSFVWFTATSFLLIFLCSSRIKGPAIFYRKSRVVFDS